MGDREGVHECNAAEGQLYACDVARRLLHWRDSNLYAFIINHNHRGIIKSKTKRSESFNANPASVRVNASTLSKAPMPSVKKPLSEEMIVLR